MIFRNLIFETEVVKQRFRIPYPNPGGLWGSGLRFGFPSNGVGEVPTADIQSLVVGGFNFNGRIIRGVRSHF